MPAGMVLSVVGLALAALYALVATYALQDDLRHTHGGFINLRGLATRVLTAPSQATLGAALAKLGVAPPSFARRAGRDVALLALHVAVTASLLYALGAGLEAVAVRLFA